MTNDVATMRLLLSASSGQSGTNGRSKVRGGCGIRVLCAGRRVQLQQMWKVWLSSSRLGGPYPSGWWRWDIWCPRCGRDAHHENCPLAHPGRGPWSLTKKRQGKKRTLRRQIRMLLQKEDAAFGQNVWLRLSDAVRGSCNLMDAMIQECVLVLVQEAKRVGAEV